MKAIKLILINTILLFNLLFIVGFSQSQTLCDFEGYARYRGNVATQTDVITAHGSNGDNYTWGEVSINQNGYYLLHVKGNDPSTPEKDGADPNEIISFKINGETANVSGNNLWVAYESHVCNIEVPDLPPVSNPGGPYSGSEGSSVSFTGSGSTGAVSYSWTFGDGGTSTAMNPTHTYVDDATYTVSLTVYNNSGQSNTAGTIAVISNVAPTASGGPDKASNEGSSVSFTGSATDPGTTDILSYSWTFGDGGSANGQNVSHTYTDNGVFTATLSVSDGDGGTGTDQVTVTVSNVAPYNVNAGSDKSGNEGASFTFSGSATDPGADVLTYSWNFGDGTSATGPSVTHAYGDNGTYTVTLTVTDDDGGSGSDQLSVTTSNVAPTANAGGPYQAVITVPIQFNGSKTDPGFNDSWTYEWDLDNDGQYDDYIGQYPEKTYATEGTYPISLRVTDDDGGSDTDDTTVEVRKGTEITVDAQPGQGMQIILDGQTYTAPHTFYLIPGSQHVLEAPLYQDAGSGSRYAWSSWSDGWGRIHYLNVTSTPATITAHYTMQYYLRIETGGVDAGYSGQGWYYPGTQVSISVDEFVMGSQGTTRYRFSRWTGQGSGAYSGTNNPAEVTVNSPITETVTWSIEYYVQIISAHGEPSGEGWYAAGRSATISIDSTVQEGEDSRYYFQSWQGEGNGSYTGTNNPAGITVNSPIVETVIWRTQYLLTLISDFGSPSGGGWYNSGTVVSVSIDTAVNAGQGARARFLNWQGVGTISYTGPNPSFQVTMNSPIIETVQWKTQYYLTLVSVRGNPRTQGWYDKNSIVTFRVDSAVSVNDSVRYGFSRWVGTGTGSYTGEDHAPGIIMLGPVTETAEWEMQYRILIWANPVWGGTVVPIAPPGGWGTASETLSLTAIGNADSSYGFSEWTGDVQSTQNPVGILMDKPKRVTAHFKKGVILIDSDPAGMRVLVDQLEYSAPVVFNWQPGESHWLEALSPQGDSTATLYQFSRWSDGGARNHQVVIPSGKKVYTAYFNASYYLNVESDYGSPTGEGLHPKGSYVTVSIDSLFIESAEIRRRFTGWTGSGNGSVTAPRTSIVVQMNGPILERAGWLPQFHLDIGTIPSYTTGVTISVVPQGPWYDPGTQVQAEVTVEDTNYTFLHWSGDISDTANPVSFLMQAPMEIKANFHVKNLPPQFARFPDIVMMEDEWYTKSFAWIGQFVHDPNDPIESLRFEFQQGAHLEFHVDTVNQKVVIVPDEDWNGTETNKIQVTDPWGKSDQDTFSVQVLPVNDNPEPFALFSPSKDTVFAEWFWPMTFSWHSSRDVDAGDSVTYSFFFSPYPSLSGPGTLTVSFLEDTLIMLGPQAAGLYYWGVNAEDTHRGKTWCSEIFQISFFTGIPVSTEIPKAYGLDPNYPNPFNPETHLRYQMPKPGQVRISIFDIRGRLIRILLEGHQNAGVHTAVWDGRDEGDEPVPSGLYIVVMEAGSFRAQKKMILVR